MTHLDALRRSTAYQAALDRERHRGTVRGFLMGLTASLAVIALITTLTTDADAKPAPTITLEQQQPDYELKRLIGRYIDQIVAWIGEAEQIDLTPGEIAMRNCESGHNYKIASASGKYSGAWQFDRPTWDGAVSRAGYSYWAREDPATAPRHIQDRAMRQLRSERGAQPWPECGRHIR
jgi:hypothetical protein